MSCLSFHCAIIWSFLSRDKIRKSGRFFLKLSTNIADDTVKYIIKNIKKNPPVSFFEFTIDRIIFKKVTYFKVRNICETKLRDFAIFWQIRENVRFFGRKRFFLRKIFFLRKLLIISS